MKVLVRHTDDEGNVSYELDGEPIAALEGERDMTFRQYLDVHPSRRVLLREPRRLSMLMQRGETPALRFVRIVGDLKATLEAETREGYLVAEASTHSMGSQAPYFSLTGTIYRSKRGARAQSDASWISGGCIHDEILEAFPNLAPIEALHLADVATGEPMHAAANGWHYYRQGDYEGAARVLRVDVSELPVAFEGDDVSGAVDEETFMAFAESLRGRWAQEAERGIALLLQLAGPTLPKPSPEGTLIEERG